MLDCLPNQPLCIPPAYAEVTRTRGVLQRGTMEEEQNFAAAVERRGVQIEHVYADVVPLPEGWSKEPRAYHHHVCRARLCVAYDLTCNAAAWGVCDLMFTPTAVPDGAPPRAEAVEWYSIHAKRPRLLARLLPELTLSVGSVPVPLDELHSSTCDDAELGYGPECSGSTGRK